MGYGKWLQFQLLCDCETKTDGMPEFVDNEMALLAVHSVEG
jgi:hypothetical protein